MRHLGALLLGVVVALAAVAVHRVAVAGVPVGLLLGGAASLAGGWQLRLGTVPRSAASYCLGWLVVVGLALTGRPEGDFAVAGDLAGYALMGVGLLLAALGVTALLPGRPGRPT